MGAAILLSFASSVQGQTRPETHLQLAAGAAFPLSNGRADFHISPYGRLGFEMQMPVAPVAIRIEVDYSEMNSSPPAHYIRVDAQRLSGTLELVWISPERKPKAYLLGGLGFSRFRLSGTGATIYGTVVTTHFAEKQTSLGWNVGAGYSFPIGRRASLFAEARLSEFDTRSSDLLSSHFWFLPLTLGLSF